MIVNLSKNRIIARNPVYAEDFITRGRGMIGRKFDTFDAMVFNRCNCIHTMFMRIRIDILFVDLDNKVCYLREKQVSWHPFIRSKEAVAVVELPEGTIAATGTEIGDRLDLNAEVAGSKVSEMSDFLSASDLIIPIKTDEVNEDIF